ncbi:MAG: hypothetical protein WCS34_02290 [Bacteroidales bacterium]
MTESTKKLNIFFRILILLSVCMYFLSFFNITNAGNFSIRNDLALGSVILSIGLLIIICISLYYVNDSFFFISKNPERLPILYLSLVLLSPNVILFSKYHVLALLLIWNLYFEVQYLAKEIKPSGSLLVGVSLLAISVLIEPAMLWLLVLTIPYKLKLLRGSHFKYLIITLGAIFLSLFWYVGLSFISHPEIETIKNLWIHFSNQLTDIRIGDYNYKIYELLLLTIIILIYILSRVKLLPRLKNSFNLARSRAFKISSLYGIIIILLLIIYNSDLFSAASLLVFIPLVLLFFDYIELSIEKIETRVLLLALWGLIIVHRFTYLFM